MNKYCDKRYGEHLRHELLPQSNTPFPYAGVCKVCGKKHWYDKDYSGTFNGSLESNPLVIDIPWRERIDRLPRRTLHFAGAR